MARKTSSSTSSSSASKRKVEDSPVEEEFTEDSKRAKVDLEGKNIGNVVGGYKATLHNPNVSDEAKEHAEEMIEKLEPLVESNEDDDDLDLEGKDLGHVIGGYKSTISNPNVSDEAKEHAQKMLDQLTPHHSEGKGLHHVLGGYKSTISNQSSSNESRQHAQKMIDELGKRNRSSYENSKPDLEGKDLGHVIAGYKASLSNRHVSKEAKEHAQQMLDQLNTHHSEGKGIHHVLGGYKAALSNTNTSSEGRKHAQKMIDELGKHHHNSESSDKLDLEGKDLGHVIGGYKATLSNPNVSDEAKEHAQKMLDQLTPHHSEGKELGHVVGGYKATLSNPNVSDEAKEHAQRMLDELLPHYQPKNTKDDSEKNPNNVIGGYKATLKNPNVSEEAKEHAREVLEDVGDSATGRSTSSHKDDAEKNPGNVIGGLKAALKNPNVSEEAKDDVRAKLDEAKAAY